MPVDSLVDSITTYYKRPFLAHAYVAPFLHIYGVWFLYWTYSLGIEDWWEIGCIITAFIAILQMLIALFCYWFVSVNCALNCVRIYDEHKATFVKVVPCSNNGWTELIPLQRTKLKNDLTRLWFIFQKVAYIFDDDKRVFCALEFEIARPIGYFRDWRGWQNDIELTEMRLEYGSNRMEINVPQFIDLFIERATAPFFVFQVFCVALWCLEDMWYYSAFTLFMLITFEATIVKQQLRNMSEIRNMGNKAYPIYVYRARRWSRVSSDELICGDLVSITRSIGEEHVVPCDLLLLRGSCIVDESMLTGESIPQMKETIEDLERSKYFDLVTDSRLHVISGGTKIVQHTPPVKTEGGIRAPDNGCVCYVLRTGFNTNQGQLLRTIMFGVKRVTANNIETFAFILFLLVFAVAASVYLWIKGSEHENRNKYKLFLECSLILTSVIPPELPIELSLAVNNSLIALQKLGIFCTEPFRIPFAGKIDICCFDKTGTLTTDNLVVEGIAMASSDSNEKPHVIRTLEDIDVSAIKVLAGCQSVVKLDEELVGDPLEKACLKWIDWNVTKQDAVVPRKGSKILPLKIFRRFYFSSQMKRMTVIAGYQPHGFSETQHLILVKGAPEVLKSMFLSLPDGYDKTYQQLAQAGARILALGIREFGPMSHQEVREGLRETFEKDLTFAGFLVTSCPLKPDTKMLIREIVDSSHKVTMITGDNPLTACHVSSVLRFVKKNHTILILDDYDGIVEWRSVDGRICYDSDLNKMYCDDNRQWRELLAHYEFCVTGAGLKYLMSTDRFFMQKLLPHIRVFARMSPKQKERVITNLKIIGYVTLMCGDGTNDVGALKHAHVGVALLSHPYDATKVVKQQQDAKNVNKLSNLSADVQRNVALDALTQRGIAPRRTVDDTNSLRLNKMQNSMQQKLDQLRREMEDDQSKVIRLGDASIAAPFTSKFTSIQSICHVIKQGRCTLVTTLQMFKILALNALILAYSQSVLYLDGVKFSDSQATIQGLLLAACFLFISRSKPLRVLAKQKPVPNIFNAYMLLTVTSQFVIHFCCLVYIVQQAHQVDPRESKIDLDSEFKPNLLNSAVYIMSMALQVSTFAVNYRGRPFMESLAENRPMLFSILSSTLVVFALASNVSGEISAKFELVDLPNEFRNILVCCVIVDFFVCYTLDRILNFFLGDMCV